MTRTWWEWTIEVAVAGGLLAAVAWCFWRLLCLLDTDTAPWGDD